MRPVKPLKPVAGVAGVLALWWLVAHNSGSGWIQVIGDGLTGSVLAGLVGPAFALRRAKVRITQTPADGTAGRPVELTITANTRVRVTPLAPPGPPAFAGPARARPNAEPRTQTLTLLPTHRGAHRSLQVEVATGAPFALLWWSRRQTVDLLGELVVAPRRGPADFPVTAAHDTDGDARPHQTTAAGAPKGVREY